MSALFPLATAAAALLLLVVGGASSNINPCGEDCQALVEGCRSCINYNACPPTLKKCLFRTTLSPVESVAARQLTKYDAYCAVKECCSRRDELRECMEQCGVGCSEECPYNHFCPQLGGPCPQCGYRLEIYPYYGCPHWRYICDGLPDSKWKC